MTSTNPRSGVEIDRLTVDFDPSWKERSWI